MPALSLIVALAIFAQAAPPPDPTRPSLVALDFKDRPAQEIAAAIAARSGNMVSYQGADFSLGDPNARKITLTATAPVPFWEAIDRLCADSKLQISLGDVGGISALGTTLSLFGPGVEPGPAS